jgi:hypothetical protein
MCHSQCRNIYIYIYIYIHTHIRTHFYHGPWAQTSSLLWFPDHTRYDTLPSVEFLWTSDQLVAETSTWQHTSLTIDVLVPGGIWTGNSSQRAAADPRLGKHGHWERCCNISWWKLIMWYTEEYSAARYLELAASREKENQAEGNLNIHSLHFQWNTYLNPFSFTAGETKISFRCLSTRRVRKVKIHHV